MGKGTQDWRNQYSLYSSRDPNPWISIGNDPQRTERDAQCTVQLQGKTTKTSQKFTGG